MFTVSLMFLLKVSFSSSGGSNPKKDVTDL